jgi:riboflavin synthase
MFTGIIEETGIVTLVSPRGDGIDFAITAALVTRDLGIDNSIAVNGTCLTVTQKYKGRFLVHAVHETLTKTNLGALRTDMRVNLERAVSLQQRLGGHLVQGHVDCIGTVKKIEQLETSWLITIAFPKRYRKYLIPVGSIAVDGVSLTVARCAPSTFTVAIIPFTMDNTIFGSYAVGTQVNLEFDLVGKYIENLMKR